ncbi:hypothetical protein EV128_1232 [Rhizobium azibense]|nr:hypothetical protein EV128_1232 [Rhizobium azibense]
MKRKCPESAFLPHIEKCGMTQLLPPKQLRDQRRRETQTKFI